MVTTSGIADHNLYGYVPSAVAAWAFVVLWGIGFVYHFVMMIVFRSWFFIPLLIGCVAEAFGYYFRTVSHGDPRKIAPFVFHGLLILAAAPLLAATIYMTLGRLTRALKAEEYSLIAPRWLTKIFVLIDLICLISQLAGSVLRAADSAKTVETGSNIVLAGLALQVAVFGIFFMIVLRLHIRLRAEPTAVTLDNKISWQWTMSTLYVMSVLFFVRNLVHIISFKEGDNGFITTHESMLYIFDAGFMLAMVALLAVWHPGRVIRRSRTIVKGWNDLRLLNVDR